jgi:hypothetical protein
VDQRWYRPDYYQQLAAAGGVARNPPGPDTPYDPAEPSEQEKVHRGGSFLCTNQYCARYVVGTRGKGELTTGTNHLGFRCVKSITFSWLIVAGFIEFLPGPETTAACWSRISPAAAPTHPPLP